MPYFAESCQTLLFDSESAAPNQPGVSTDDCRRDGGTAPGAMAVPSQWRTGMPVLKRLLLGAVGAVATTAIILMSSATASANTYLDSMLDLPGNQRAGRGGLRRGGMTSGDVYQFDWNGNWWTYSRSGPDVSGPPVPNMAGRRDFQPGCFATTRGAVPASPPRRGPTHGASSVQEKIEHRHHQGNTAGLVCTDCDERATLRGRGERGHALPRTILDSRFNSPACRRCRPA